MRSTFLAVLLLIYSLPVFATGASGIACSTTAVELSAANGSRKLFTAYNDDSKNVRVRMGSAASTTVFTVLIAPGGYWEMPPLANGGYYTGPISGIWEAACTGAARVTEY